MSEFADFKTGMRKVWGMGEYAPIAERLLPAARSLVDACAISAGQEVLDVAAGTGNLALLAAEEGADVTACDLSPDMVEIGRERLAAEGVDVDWHVADAEDLPFDDASFECVASVFGAIFAPRPEVVSAELFRVVKPGNTVGLATWGEYGAQTEIFRLAERYRPQPPFDFDPRQWGDEDVVRQRLGPYAATIEMNRRTMRWEFGSYEQAWEVFSNVGPQAAMRERLPAEVIEELRSQTIAVFERVNIATDGTFAYDAEYLEIVARKRG